MQGKQLAVVGLAGQSERVDVRGVVFHRLAHVLFFQAECKVGALGHVSGLVQVVGIEAVRFNHPRSESTAFLLPHVHQHRQLCRCFQAAAGEYFVFDPLFFQRFGEVDEVLGGAGQYVAELLRLLVDFFKSAKCAVGAHHRHLEVGRRLLLPHELAHRRTEQVCAALRSIDADIAGH